MIFFPFHRQLSFFPFASNHWNQYFEFDHFRARADGWEKLCLLWWIINELWADDVKVHFESKVKVNRKFPFSQITKFLIYFFWPFFHCHMRIQCLSAAVWNLFCLNKAGCFMTGLCMNRADKKMLRLVSMNNNNKSISFPSVPDANYLLTQH